MEDSGVVIDPSLEESAVTTNGEEEGSMIVVEAPEQYDDQRDHVVASPYRSAGLSSRVIVNGSPGKVKVPHKKNDGEKEGDEQAYDSSQTHEGDLFVDNNEESQKSTTSIARRSRLPSEDIDDSAKISGSDSLISEDTHQWQVSLASWVGTGVGFVLGAALSWWLTTGGGASAKRSRPVEESAMVSRLPEDELSLITKKSLHEAHVRALRAEARANDAEAVIRRERERVKVVKAEAAAAHQLAEEESRRAFAAAQFEPKLRDSEDKVAELSRELKALRMITGFDIEDGNGWTPGSVPPRSFSIPRNLQPRRRSRFQEWPERNGRGWSVRNRRGRGLEVNGPEAWVGSVVYCLDATGGTSGN